MKETFYGTGTMYLPKLNWPKDSLAELDNKSLSKFTIYASVGGRSHTDIKNKHICTDWWEIQDILEEINDEYNDNIQETKSDRN